MTRTSIRELLASGLPGQAARVAGWVRTRRDSKGGFSFLELNDGSTQANLQVVADGKLANYAAEVLKLHPGASVRATGAVQASGGRGQRVELLAGRIEVLGFCDPEGYPLQKQKISFDRLRELAHLRPRTNTFGAVSRVRNVLAYATHRFFQERGFLWLNTPILTASDCEGAGQMFQATTLDLEKPPRTPEGGVDWDADFFGTRAHLTVSGQLEAETHACALGRVYTFGPTFRAENSNTTRHLAEFWMVEPEMAFADLAADADLACDYLRFLIRAVLDGCGPELDFLVSRVDPDLRRTLEAVAGAEFRRMTYAEAVAVLRASGRAFEHEPRDGADLHSEHERFLTEEAAAGPLVVTDYPKGIKAFYMRQNDDGRTVAAMDVLLPRVGEIIGGSQREERLEVLESRMREVGLDPASYGWYLDLRRFGTVPHAGFGLGFERMVQYCTGLGNIRDAIPFPRAPRHLFR